MLYGKYTFSCELKTSALLPPYKGSTFRGAFGKALKRVVCALKRQECPDCPLFSRCIYTQFFEERKGENLPAHKNAAAPHPYVIEPPLTEKTSFKEGDLLDFSIILFGKATEYLPYCIFSIDQMSDIGIGKKINGRHSAFTLKSVTTKGEQIYSAKEKSLAGGSHASQLLIPEQPPAASGCHTITVRLVTPLRVKHENHLHADLPFHILIRTALRRVSSLFATFGDGEPAFDYKGMVERAMPVETADTSLRWFDWERYSNRQEQRMFMGGMLGSISYKGSNIGEFLPLLRICEEIHLGKQTTLGLGQIALETASHAYF